MTKKAEKKKDKGENKDHRKVRKIHSPAKKGTIPRTLIEKAVKEVIAERSSD